MPIYPCTIRQPMRADGSAGDELPSGEIGHVCFRGPQTFLGYVNDPAATAQAISRDGFLYTGDLGYKDAAGLHLTGRDKWVIKSLGYQIFPGDVEAHICTPGTKRWPTVSWSAWRMRSFRSAGGRGGEEARRSELSRQELDRARA
jgi:non-ribosomal peptide synthetase component E (peptide arylation enzyme)